MGTWNVSITGNDTAQDLRSEYSAVFFKYDPEEGSRRIDEYVRAEMFDESDEEEWSAYVYSLKGNPYRRNQNESDSDDRLRFRLGIMVGGGPENA